MTAFPRTLIVADGCRGKKFVPNLSPFEKSVSAEFAHPKLPEPVVNLGTILNGTGGRE
jgi:hypothetical protein